MDLDESWKSACKVLLGSEVGELEEFQGYLSQYNEQLVEKPSCISGESVIVGDEDFGPGSRFVSDEEAQKLAAGVRGLKLDLNELKDIDSIVAALNERFVYAGSSRLGQGEGITGSHRCVNSFFVQGSHDISDCKYVAYSSMHRKCQYIFGCSYTGQATYGIRSAQFYQSTRCMEAILTMLCADCHYTANLQGCQQCMFSFNLKNKSWCIGNRALAKDQYMTIKESLLEQMRGELEQKKTLPGIVDLLNGAGGMAEKAKKDKTVQVMAPSNKLATQNQTNRHPITNEVQTAFDQTTQVILGTKLGSLADYREWLIQHVRQPMVARSALSGQPILVPPNQAYAAWKDAALDFDEAWALGERQLTSQEIEKLTLGNAKQTLSHIAHSTPDLHLFENARMVDCVNYYSSSDCQDGAGFYIVKKSACSFYLRENDWTFGGDIVFYSQFCIRCYHSYNLTRCLDVSDSRSCADCYFCHNCENVRNGLFCFNAKNLNYAIGNVEVGPEKFAQIKKLVMDELVGKLKKDKMSDVDVYSLGSKNRKA
jgi:hypothetical protein